MPPTTPPTIAPVLDFFSGLSAMGAAEGVKTTVRVTTTPLSVTTVGTVLGSSVVVGSGSSVGFGVGDADFDVLRVDDGSGSSSCLICQ
jgi:hypothetical protein